MISRGGWVACALLGGRAMDPMHFSIKRVYWSGHARIRELVHPLGITPARADLLRVVAMHEYGIAQSTLTQHLGVSAPTISKMLGAMINKGWCERFSAPRGGGNIIHATRAGLVLIAQVIHRFLLSGALPLRMAMAWGHGLAAKKLRASLYRLLNRARRAFLDRAPFLHPWRKEETYVRRKYTLWEARLRADDVDDTIVEDLDEIRARAKAPIACEPPPRSSYELKNIEANRRHDHDDTVAPPTSTHPPDFVGPAGPTLARVGADADNGVGADAKAAADPDAKTAADAEGAKAGGAETSDATDVPPEVLRLWKALAELGGARGPALEDMPKWDEPES